VAVSSSSPVGLFFNGGPTTSTVELAVRAEKQGFDAVWIAETRLTRDAIVPIAAVAAATRTVRIGTGILPVYTRGAALLAITFLSLDELAPGRVLMGLGTGSPRVLAQQGYEVERPLTRLREYCEVIPRLIRGEDVTYEGKEVRLAGARVEDVLSEANLIAEPQRRIPLWLGVTGPKALEYAGQVADGILMNACLPASYVASRGEFVQAGARRAGRGLDEIERAMVILVSPHADSSVGKRRAARFIALYLSLFPNIARETGLPRSDVTSIRETFHAGGLDAATDRVGDEIVDLLAAAGTVTECRTRLNEYREAGVQLPVLLPVEGSMELAMSSLA
jgi:5,10-methylenetetrahydromethanopterin reductase